VLNGLASASGAEDLKLEDSLEVAEVLKTTP
jgi:hypothetical protein